MHIAAVTGTNGKTSTAEFSRQLFSAGGLEGASFSSLGWTDRWGRDPAPAAHGKSALRDLLDGAEWVGTDAVVVEAFSSSLAGGMLDGVTVDAAAFTNLSRDHLDHHGTIADYFAAKMRLFGRVLRQDGTAVINADTEPGRFIARLVRERGGTVLHYGRAKGADLRLVSARQASVAIRVNVEILGCRAQASINTVGSVMVYNLLAAMGLALAAGLAPSTILASVSSLKPPPGRFEHIGSHRGSSVFVDYAHTPDALTALLQALRPLTTRRLMVVFGCGGGRDAGKRAMMGRIAASLADVVVITDDNPRAEDPAIIRAAIRAGCPDAIEIAGRAQAIDFALSRLRSGDVLAIAGRGEETQQQSASGSVPFLDRAVAQRSMSHPACDKRLDASAPQ